MEDHCDNETAIMLEYHSLIKHGKTEVQLCGPRMRRG